MPETPKISIVMPSLNVRPYIQECIESVRNQTLREIEIFCVDAGSDDGTLEFLRMQEAEDSRVHVLISDKRSYGYQVNMGYRAAKGKYFAIVETDDVIPANMMRVLYETAEREKVDFVKSDFSKFTGNGAKRRFERYPIASDRKLYNRVLNPQEDPDLLRQAFYTWAGIYNREFLLKNEILHNETPGASYQDNGFYFQTMTRAKRIYLLKKNFYRLRRDNPNSSTLSKGKVYCMCAEYDFIRKKLAERPETEGQFAPYCALKRFFNYSWTMERVAPESKREFIHRFAEDFRQIEAAGELQKDLFSELEWPVLRAIMDDPEAYWQRTYGYAWAKENQPVGTLTEEEYRRYIGIYQAQIRALDGELKHVYNSHGYRIGRGITWIPGKMIGLIICLKDNGWTYTVRQLKQHIRGEA